jgi:predicted O-methyltransferase YrrM
VKQEEKERKTMSKMAPELKKCFSELTPERGDLLKGLEAQAAREGIPIVGPLVARLLTILTRLSGGRRVLELGTATGYSALHIAQGLADDGSLISLERDPGRAAEAKANFQRAGAEKRVQVLEGEAMQALAGLSGSFDLAFLDFEKTGYLNSLPHLHRLLRPGGLLVADNTGFAAAQDFNQALKDSPQWQEVNLLCYQPQHSPEYDGVALALRL